MVAVRGGMAVVKGSEIEESFAWMNRSDLCGEELHPLTTEDTGKSQRNTGESTGLLPGVFSL